MNKLPLYKAYINPDDETGISQISLVDYPAVESNWIALKKDCKLQFAVENEEKHLIRGVIMRANFPIYRVTEQGYEYFIEYDKETIRMMAQKYLKEGFQNNIDTMHNNQLEDGVYMTQWFIKDEENGISPKGFEDIEDGSLFAEFKVENEDIWKQIKDGTFKGFSLAGVFNVEEVISEDEQEFLDILALVEKIKNKLNKSNG